jgi:hypothetical protein
MARFEVELMHPLFGGPPPSKNNNNVNKNTTTKNVTNSNDIVHNKYVDVLL